MLVLNPIAVVAVTNGQSPNDQVWTDNTSFDYSSWARMSMTTQEPFHFTSTSGHFSYQMNTYLNGCTADQAGCTWWMQGLAIVSSTGILTEWSAWEWEGTSSSGTCYNNGSLHSDCVDFCDLVDTSNSINVTDYAMVQQTTLLNSSATHYEGTIVNTAYGNNVVQWAQDCDYNSGGSEYGPVHYFWQVEGVIVGWHGSEYASFTPLQSTLFSGYIDLVSNYNLMSALNATTQTGETSNLYQHVLNAYGETYGSMYLYTIQSNENTGTSK